MWPPLLRIGIVLIKPADDVNCFGLLINTQLKRLESQRLGLFFRHHKVPALCGQRGLFYASLVVVVDVIYGRFIDSHFIYGVRGSYVSESWPWSSSVITWTRTRGGLAKASQFKLSARNGYQIAIRSESQFQRDET